MKHHALLGLILGLFAAARTGAAEPPVLFNVEINPSTRTATITATANTPSPLSGNATGILYLEGITFLNFFPTGLNSGLTDVTEAPLTPNKIRNNPGDPVGITVYPSAFQTAGTTGTLLAYDVYKPIAEVALPEGVQNTSSNLNLYGLISAYDPQTLTDYSTSDTANFGADSIFGAASAARITFTSDFSFSTSLTDYNLSALRVYAGINDTFFGDSFLGTYTISVVPEPSTYAAIAGGLGLAAAVIHRRRQRAKAAQA